MSLRKENKQMFRIQKTPFKSSVILYFEFFCQKIEGNIFHRRKTQCFKNIFSNPKSNLHIQIRQTTFLVSYLVIYF